MKEVILSSDNTGCYADDVGAPMFYLIAVSHGCNFHVYLYPNAKYAKGPVDSHFSVTKRCIHKNLKWKKSYVTCPTDLIIALK